MTDTCNEIEETLRDSAFQLCEWVVTEILGIVGTN